MGALDFPALCSSVDSGYEAWRRPALLVWGAGDPFCDLKVAFEFLESKRTCMRLAQLDAKVRAGA